eukprot:CAMPEP_0204640854 /NCGR_PEP_ID=MMETSP0717-20131115/49038_1 /ASSEMBLY_ACC=CAM_ASM_000666 /TAXON_ID=230516 /ORGANISM="Chaetoceros curvisetus" /LENGTH=109 /DNA_ID=CAMNT_0051661381 /DNA_START=39 /DNA_END=368 /DNA_ORIENTATION=-
MKNKSLFIFLSILGSTVEGFSPSVKPNLSTAMDMCGGKDGDEKDPTKVWYASIADGVQNILTNSPLKAGKKALVRSLAGDYDQVATRAKLDSYIADSAKGGILMLSFTK